MISISLKKGQKKQEKQIFPERKAGKKNSSAEVKILLLIKSILEGLPIHQEYRIQNQIQYNRKMAKVLSLLSSVRLQQIPYIVSCETFKKIIIQLTRQTSNKQISICLLKQFSKGFSEYIEPLSKHLYDVLSFMIEMNSLGKKKERSSLSETDSYVLMDDVLSKAIFELIKSISKWYGLNDQGRQISAKYQSLIEFWKK